MTEINDKNDENTSLRDNFIMDNPEIEWCAHYHREDISYEQGIEENRPEEERVDRMPSVILGECFVDKYSTDNSNEQKRIRYYSVKKSDLVPSSESECRCLKCGQRFPREKIRHMEQRFQRMNELADAKRGYTRLVDLQFLELSQGLEPVWFHRKIDGSIEILEKKTNPSDWERLGRKKDLFIDDMAEANYVKNEPANLFCNIPEAENGIGKSKLVCKHYFGMAYWILREWALEVPRFVGEAKTALVNDEHGVCKCSKCNKVFSEEEQFKMNQLIAYLNTPHYCTEEDFLHNDEWSKIFQFYDEGYSDDNDPFQLFDLKKALKFSEGIEPIVFKYKKNDKKKILYPMKWQNGAWRIDKNKTFPGNLIKKLIDYYRKLSI